MLNPSSYPNHHVLVRDLILTTIGDKSPRDCLGLFIRNPKNHMAAYFESRFGSFAIQFPQKPDGCITVWYDEETLANGVYRLDLTYQGCFWNDEIESWD